MVGLETFIEEFSNCSVGVTLGRAIDLSISYLEFLLYLIAFSKLEFPVLSSPYLVVSFKGERYYLFSRLS